MSTKTEKTDFRNITQELQITSICLFIKKVPLNLQLQNKENDK